jgi:S-adenosylmethionine synthetase
LDTYGTSPYRHSDLLKVVDANFDLRPGHIVEELKLDCPIYQKTAVYGHFGREQFTWEKPKTLDLSTLPHLQN